jgi:hypothetical protein
VQSNVDSAVDFAVDSVRVHSAVDSGVVRSQLGGWLVVIRQQRLDLRPTSTHIPHWVEISSKGATCSGCHFAAKFLLPCRHILAVNLRMREGQAFQVGQCHQRWLLKEPLQRRQQHHENDGGEHLYDALDWGMMKMPPPVPTPSSTSTGWHMQSRSVVCCMEHLTRNGTRRGMSWMR